MKFFYYSLCLIVIFLCGCGELEKYGEKISSAEKVSVSEIFAGKEQLNNKVIKIEGKIVRECPTGCWFDVKDKTGIVYVDIRPYGLAIPQRVGKNVVVEGKIKTEDGRITVVGKGVEIK